MNSGLSQLGWSAELETVWNGMEPGAFIPGRVIADYGHNYKVATPQEITAELSGRIEYKSGSNEMPKIGDWVSVQLLDDNHGMIHSVLPRKSEITRKRPGNMYTKQVLAANVDLAFLVQALDDDFSTDRLRRYMFQLQKSGIASIIVLNKSDKTDDLASYLSDIEAFNATVIVTSAKENKGIDEIADSIAPRMTAVFLGSSGVGKSTITNLLIGEEKQATRSIRDEDSKGRHTTTHRELFTLPNGGLIIDTPGLRELQLWGDEDDLASTFPKIETLSKSCKFNDCSHTVESNCAVLGAVHSGELDEAELEAYFKFQKELRYLNTKIDVNAAIERKRKSRRFKDNTEEE